MENKPRPETERVKVESRFDFTLERLREVFTELEEEQLADVAYALTKLEHDTADDTKVGALFAELIQAYIEAGLEPDEDEIMGLIDTL